MNTRHASGGSHRSRGLSAAVVLAMAWSVVAMAPARSAEGASPTDLGPLRRGQPVFVDVATGVDDVVANMECTEENCWQFTFDVREAGRNRAGGKELRVGVQASRRSDFWSIRIVDPNGDVISDGNAPFTVDPGSGARLNLQQWTIERRVTDPAPGTWLVRVMVQDTEVGLAEVESGLDLRLRIALDPEPHDVYGPPNLRPRPPYEFGLAAPANPTSGATVDRHNPPLAVGGAEPVSCSWDEIELAVEHGEEPPTRCLRFSVGVYEAGAGRVDLRLEGYEGGLGPHEGNVVQRVHLGSEQYEERPVGGWKFHMTHGHPHYLGFVRYELDRVTRDVDGTYSLEAAGSTGKTGYYTADQRIADWASFAQDEQWAAITSCDTACIALGAGWEDHYRWQRTGQYVPIDGDGLYVVRLRVNAGELPLLESTTEDNTAYALVAVAGNGVRVCERGLGDHPWAANAQPIVDEWRPERSGSPLGAAACP